MTLTKESSFEAESLTLRPSKWLWSGVAIGSLLFVAAGSWALSTGMTQARWMMWVCVVFFGACTLVALIVLLPRASELRLDSEGFTITLLFRKVRCRWDDVAEPFRVVDMEGPPMVTMELRPELGGTGSRALARWNKRMTGMSGGLPDTYGLRAHDLAALMNSWRERALARRSVQPRA